MNMHGRESKKPQKALVSSSDDFEKDFSKHTAPSFTIDVEAGEVNEASSFASAIDGLTEKSTGTRHKSLLNIAALLQYRGLQDWEIEDRTESLTEGIKKSLKSSNQYEQYLAARVAALYGVYLGTNSEFFFKSLNDTFDNLIKVDTTSTASKAEFVKAWGMLLFIAGDADETIETLNKFIGWASETKDSAFLQAALSAYTFCATALPISTITNELIPNHGNQLSKILFENTDVYVRSAACQSITFLIDSARQEEHAEKQFESDADTFDVYSLDGYFEIDTLLETIEACALHKTASLSKEEQKVLKSNFKNFLSSINEGYCPEEILSIKTVSTKIHDWATLLQLYYFRDVLQGGLLDHLAGNDLLHQIFELDGVAINKPINYSRNKVERRAFQSKNSSIAKERTKELRKTQRKTVVADD